MGHIARLKDFNDILKIFKNFPNNYNVLKNYIRVLIFF